MDGQTSLFFIVEGKKIEAQSWLLVSSLARHAPDAERIAYTTPAYLPQVSPATRAHFERCGVELRVLPDAGGIWAKPYPQGNKLIAANEVRGRAVSVFLDTDMVLTRPLSFGPSHDDLVRAVPEGVMTWGHGERWRRAYKHFGMEVPQDRVQLVRFARKTVPPYFNAGLVAFPETGPLGRFGAQWLLTALDFDHHCKIANKRPWLDQICLPLTMKRYGYRYDVLDETLNYSTKNRGDDEVDEADPVVIHYHRDPYFVRWLAGRTELEAMKAMIRA